MKTILKSAAYIVLIPWLMGAGFVKAANTDNQSNSPSTGIVQSHDAKVLAKGQSYEPPKDDKSCAAKG